MLMAVPEHRRSQVTRLRAAFARAAGHEKAISMMRGSLSTAVVLIVATTLRVSAQPSVPTGPFEINLNEATAHFVEIFERTCYRHRHELEFLVNERPSPEFEKIPRVYPSRDEAQKSTMFAEWGAWSRGAPYSIGLLEFDSSPGVKTCILASPYSRKSTVAANMLSIKELNLFKEIEEDDDKIVSFMHQSEPSLRILCRTPKAEQLFNVQCSLWSWRDKAS